MAIKNIIGTDFPDYVKKQLEDIAKKKMEDLN